MQSILTSSKNYTHILQDPSLRLVPANGAKSASIKDTANSLGLHDSLAYGPRNIAAEVTTTSAVKERLESVSINLK